MKQEKTFDNSNTTTNSKQLEILKNNFPQCFDKNGDFIPHKIEEIVAKDGINLSKEGYSLNWLGKSYARLLANEEPLTLLKEDTQHNQKPQNQNSENLLIKGDNLEVLKHLRHAYSESIKMIYIDPPYNTGSDGFVYSDNRKFTPEQLQRLAGIDEDEAKRILDFTASKSNSHSAWLTFIYPRLYIARELLSDDGVIFISIDDNEQAQLKLLCDEVFGEENFVGEIAWESKTKSQNTKTSYDKLQPKIEHILLYTKKDCRRFNLIKNGEKQYPEKDSKGVYREYPLEVMNAEGVRGRNSMVYEINQIFPPKGKQWKLGEEKINKYQKRDDLLIDGKKIILKMRPDDEKQDLTNPFWGLLSKEIGTAESAKKELTEILESNKHGFETVKPVDLIKRLIFHSTKNDNSLIMDFFAGSGTTADAVMQLNAEDGGNRRCISVQLDEPIDEAKNKTAYDFVKNELKQENPTIFDICKERILRAGAKIQKDNSKSKEPKDLSNLDTGFKVFETLPMFDGYLDEADEQESEQLTLFDGKALSNNDLQNILTSWMVSDGAKLTEKIQRVTLDKYTAYYADKKLYLLSKEFTTDDLKALLEKIDATDSNNKNFQPNKIILFGYNFESKHQREISEALNSYVNKKQIELDRVIKY